jgi:hypothetical protein
MKQWARRIGFTLICVSSRSLAAARRSAIDGRTTRHPGYAISQRIRKRIEEAFGWVKTVAGLRKMGHRCSRYRRLLQKSALPPT